jgi:hypothetical protein
MLQMFLNQQRQTVGAGAQLRIQHCTRLTLRRGTMFHLFLRRCLIFLLMITPYLRPSVQFPLNTAGSQQQPTQAANYQPVATDNTLGMLPKPNPIVPHGAPLQQFSQSFRQEICVGQFVDPASALQHSNIESQVGSSIASGGASYHSNSLLGPYPGNGNAYSQPPLTMPLTEMLQTTGGEHLHAECRDLRQLSIKGPGIDDDDLILSAIHLSSTKSRRLQPSSKSPDKHRLSSDSRSDRRTSSKWRDSQSISGMLCE